MLKKKCFIIHFIILLVLIVYPASVGAIVDIEEPPEVDARKERPTVLPPSKQPPIWPEVEKKLHQHLKFSVTVANFENRANFLGKFDIVAGTKVLFEDSLKQDNLTVINMGTENVNMTPAQILVKGAITHVKITQSRAIVSAVVYLIHTSTGQILASQSLIGDSEEAPEFVSDFVGKALKSSSQKFIFWIREKLQKATWMGNVILIKDGIIYVNRGERDGVLEGMEFAVGTIKALRDARTGEVFDTNFSQVGIIRIESVKDRVALAQLVAGPKDQINKGMFIQVPSR